MPYIKTWYFGGIPGYEDADTFTGWWADSFDDKHRYRPDDYERAQRDPKALGEYALRLNNGPGYGWRGVTGWRNHSSPVQNDGFVSAMDCYMQSGTPVRYTDFLTVETNVLLGNRYKPEVIIRRPINRKTSTGKMFVGQHREDLENLPNNPKNWNGRDHYLFQNGEARLVFPL